MLTANTSVLSNVSGPATIRATVGNLTQTQQIIFSQNTVSLNLAVTNNPVPADNNSYATVIATANDPNVVLKMNTITFTTNKGTFANNSNVFMTNAFSNNNNGSVTAIAYLKDNHAETATVTATISNTNIFTAACNVTFNPSVPNQVLLYSSKPTITDTLPDSITAKLVLTNGTPSAGQKVTFTEYGVRNNTNTIAYPGAFYNTSLSDTTGTVKTIFSIQAQTFHGYVHILGTIGTVSDSTIIYVQ